MSLMEDRALEYQVDSKGEGGLVCELDRSPMIDQPTLIIGLGGTGIDAMLHAKYVIQRKILAPAGKKRPDRLAFLAVDTDQNAFVEKRVGDVRVEDSERVLINEPNLASYMRNHDLIPQAYMKDWLCKGINADAIKFGAGGIRQCGRFMLIDRAQEFIDKLTQAANQTWGAGQENGVNFSNNTKYNIYLLTGVSGGTGSGTFLDAAYLIREVIEHHINKQFQLRGIVFMPDVNLCKVSDSATRAYIPVNGYAALRELDFWMNSSRGRNFRQKYTPVVSVDTPDAPFDLCFFVSPNGALPADYDGCMQTTGEALMNILTAPDKDGGDTLDFESYVTNLVAMLDGQLKTTYSANYIYASMGMDEQRLQLDSMANYLAYYLLLKVQGLFDREPIKEEVDTFFNKELKLDSKRGLWRQFDKTIPARPFNEVVRNLDDFKKAINGYKKAQVLDDNLLEAELQTWVNQCQVTYNKNLNDLLEQCMEALRHALEEKFVNLDFGPYYVHRMLHNVDVGKMDVLKKLEEEKNAMFAFLQTASDRETNLKQIADKALKSARSNRHVPLMSTPKYNEYVDAVFRYYDHLRYTAFAGVALQFYTRMLNAATDYNNQVVERFANLLKHLTQVFKNNSDIITNVSKDGTMHTWNVGNFEQIRETVDEALANLKTAGKEDALVGEFLSMMLRDRVAWVGDEGGLGESFSRFVSEKFHDLMEMTMEETYKQMEGLTSDAQLMSHIQSTVLPRLQAGAKVLYTPDAKLSPLENSPGRAMVAVPSAATHIREAVSSYVKAQNIQCDVVVSKRQGSLFWFQASFGLPLYAHDALRTYQNQHDVFGGSSTNKHLGRYLKMGADENWEKLLPPLMPEATWAYAKYENPEWAKRNAATRRMFREAWDAGLVQPLEEGSPVRVLGRVDKEAYDKILASAVIPEADRAKLLAQGSAVAASMNLDMAAVEAFVASAEEFDRTAWKPSQKEIFAKGAFNLLGDGEFVAEEKVDPELRAKQILCENLLWTPDLANKLAQQLKMKRTLEEIIRAHKIFLELGQTAQREQQSFADALIYGVYKPTAPKVFQLDGTDVGVASFMLMSIADYKLAPVADPFYALFRKYQTFTAEQKQIMARICEVRQAMMNDEMNRGVTERYNRYVKTVRGIDAAMQKRLKAINMDVTFNNPQIRQFYLDMHASFELFLPGDMG